MVLIDEDNDIECSKNVVQPDITIICDLEILIDNIDGYSNLEDLKSFIQ